jgi:thiol-disulfide isomerase/thioredoxin
MTERSAHTAPHAGRGQALRALVVAVALLGLSSAGAAGDEPPVLVFYWAVGCPHCEDAKPFVRQIEEEHDGLVVRWIEVRQDPDGRRHFIETVRALELMGAGVPAFVIGDRAVVGFQLGVTEVQVREMVAAALGRVAPEADAAPSDTVHLPLLGPIAPAEIPFPAFTVIIGVVDGVNPCAIWVLLVMLGVLLRVRSRARLLLFGATFVAMSGVVYFLFMSAWTGLFTLAGMSRPITRGLGIALMIAGAINVKEIFWFRGGVSLMVPERAKPGLYRRMRAIAAAGSLPVALAGIAVLAFVVNLIELGCTIGLPAVYTRLLTLRDFSPAQRYAYLALYNLAYVVPLALTVVAFALTLHRFTLGERGAKILKVVSGALLLGFGLLFVLAPQILG